MIQENLRKEEQERIIKGFENYSVSISGEVKNIVTGKVLKPKNAGSGYCAVALDGKNYYIHRIVAQAFPEICGEWFDGCEVNHKNEVKTDNAAINLEVCDRGHNMRYGTLHSRRVSHTDYAKRTANTDYARIVANRRPVDMKEVGKKTSKPVICVETGVVYSGTREAERVLGINHNTINKVANGKPGYHTAGGYHFKYVS